MNLSPHLDRWTILFCGLGGPLAATGTGGSCAAHDCTRAVDADDVDCDGGPA